MSVEYDFEGQVVLVTGAGGALGGGVVEAFTAGGATVAAADLLEPDEVDLPDGVTYYQGDFTDEEAVADTVEHVVDAHGGIDALVNVAGTWRGGSPVDETDVELFDFLFDVNLKTMFLASKHALSHLRESDGGAIVSVSARSSLEGGTGDSVYRATKAGVRLITESIAEENRGEVRANAIMPSVIDTPANREMMPDADHDSWPTPAEIAEVICFLCSDASGVTSGAAVPVYGEA
ncbi:SDR family oxidoreductase [Salinigranum halophilum]|jgi:NAD(P)-dependent dehydrogenase (short-subunit alcohol dehydrogenase family)|uniref:SDR family oxidoreductase n=1 Tax=Salinigranum halophilum TaxID=2565931 RepID=UPI0010A888CA|nr:SDR family NAD(P)-dependent oxidoreductase [Salinigranum halophilum]